MVAAHANLPGPDSELARLAAALFEGAITATDRDRLAIMLRDPEARAAYRKTVWLHANLMRIWCQEIGGMPWVPQPLGEVVPREDPPAHRSRRPGFSPRWERLRSRVSRAAAVLIAIMLGATALGLAAVVGIGFFRTPSLAIPSRPPRAIGSIAEISAVASPVWAAGSVPGQVWQSLMPGAKVELQSGLVEIACDGGAKIVLEGPARFTLDARSAAALDRGKATITVASTGAGDGKPRFTLQTPSATVTDIGTSFGVVVSEKGETAVSVFDGLVDLLPRLDGAVPLRLTAGEAGDVVNREPARRVPPLEQRFVRSLPKAPSDLAASLAKHGWNEARATVLVRDSFDGMGSLAGSKPCGREGVGDAAWLSPKEGWQLDSSAGALVATSHGMAVLPFVPQPGHRYRISAAIHALAGGVGWGGIGFTSDTGVANYIPKGPWLLQRHRTDGQANRAYAGPGETNAVGRGDTLTGEQTRTILLDTTGPQWRAVFFVDGILLGEATINPHTAAISHVCLAAFPNSRIEFRHFLVSAMANSRDLLQAKEEISP